MAIDPIELRNAFGTFMTGVTIVTTKEKDGTPRGFTANSFSSVSLEPALLLICIANTAFSADVFKSASGFAINILAEDQIETSNLFASKSAEKFENSDWHDGPAGNPLLEGVVSWFDCTVHDVFEAGDHFILIGKVEAFQARDAGPLGYARGGYVTLDLERKAAQRAEIDQMAVSTIVEHDSKVFLLPGKKPGTLALPRQILKAGDATIPSMEAKLRSHKLDARIGYLYSVYDDAECKYQEIVYRAVSKDNTGTGGKFYDLDSLDISRMETKTLGRILTRFRTEHQNQNFGIYIGPAKGGEVHPVA